MDYISLVIVIIVLVVCCAGLWIAISAKLSNTNSFEDVAELNRINAELSSELKLINYQLSQKEQEFAIHISKYTLLEQQYQVEKTKAEELNNKLYIANDAKIRCEAENINLHKSYQNLEQMLIQLKATFNQEFINIKQLAIKELAEKANSSLREVGKDAIVVPLESYLKALQEKIIQLETQTSVMNKNSESLNKQAENLAFALTRDSKKKGDFGEMILANLLESVGLQDKISYTEQLQISYAGKKYIPDMVVHLPHDRAVIVDSKNIMKQYYDAVISHDEYDAKLMLSVISATIKDLASKDYARILDEHGNKAIFAYAIMFIPNESLFSAILAEDQLQNCRITRDAYSQKVFLAGPSTLLALLSMIDKAWETYQVEERAEEIIKLSLEVSSKIHSTIQRIADLGSNLKKSVGNYNDVIKSLDNGTAASMVAKLGKISLLSGKKDDLQQVNLVDVEISRPSDLS